MRRRLALLLALTLAPGCGASLARLERGHHYDEAICGAREQAFPEGQVAAVVRRALDPAIHVAVVPRERTAELVEHALVRVTYDSNTIPLQGFDAAFNLVRAGSSRRRQARRGRAPPAPGSISSHRVDFASPRSAPEVRSVEPG